MARSQSGAPTAPTSSKALQQRQADIDDNSAAATSEGKPEESGQGWAGLPEAVWLSWDLSQARRAFPEDGTYSWLLGHVALDDCSAGGEVGVVLECAL
jgi:hypothetical protein